MKQRNACHHSLRQLREECSTPISQAVTGEMLYSNLSGSCNNNELGKRWRWFQAHKTNERTTLGSSAAQGTSQVHCKLCQHPMLEVFLQGQVQYQPRRSLVSRLLGQPQSCDASAMCLPSSPAILIKYYWQLVDAHAQAKVHIRSLKSVTDDPSSETDRITVQSLVYFYIVYMRSQSRICWLFCGEFFVWWYREAPEANSGEHTEFVGFVDLLLIYQLLIADTSLQLYFVDLLLIYQLLIAYTSLQLYFVDLLLIYQLLIADTSLQLYSTNQVSLSYRLMDVSGLIT